MVRRPQGAVGLTPRKTYLSRDDGRRKDRAPTGSLVRGEPRDPGGRPGGWRGGWRLGGELVTPAGAGDADAVVAAGGAL